MIAERIHGGASAYIERRLGEFKQPIVLLIQARLATPDSFPNTEVSYYGLHRQSEQRQREV